MSFKKSGRWNKGKQKLRPAQPATQYTSLPDDQHLIRTSDGKIYYQDPVTGQHRLVARGPRKILAPSPVVRGRNAYEEARNVKSPVDTGNKPPDGVPSNGDARVHTIQAPLEKVP